MAVTIHTKNASLKKNKAKTFCNIQMVGIFKATRWQPNTKYLMQIIKSENDDLES